MNTTLKKLALLSLTLSMTAFAFADRESSVPTAHFYSDNASIAQIDDILDQGFRITGLEVVSSSPFRLSANFVKNTGHYEKGWTWLVDRTLAQIRQHAVNNNMRPIDIERYTVNGQVRYTGVFISNTGDDAANFQIIDAYNFNGFKSFVTNFNGRITDIETFVLNGTTYYFGVMIKNTGQNYKQTGWFANRTFDQMSSIVNETGLQLTDVERQSNGNFTGVVQDGNAAWWLQTNRTLEQLDFSINQFGARMIDVERRVVNNAVRFDAVFINNSNDLETRIGNILRGNSDGARGFYLRQINGPTLGGILENYTFYPASTIKILEHLFWTDRVDNGSANAFTNIRIYNNTVADTHPIGTPFINRALQISQQNMMWNSSNADTNALQDAAGGNVGTTGRQNIRNFKNNVLGLNDQLEINHKFGNGGPANDPANRGALVQFGKLYEKATDGSVLSATGETYLRANMFNQTQNITLRNAIRNVVTQEGTEAGLTQAERTQFFNQMRIIWKDGNWNGAQYVSCFGHIEIPRKVRGGSVVFREYVFGSFLDQTTNVIPGFSINVNVMPEIVRDEIRKALETW